MNANIFDLSKDLMFRRPAPIFDDEIYQFQTSICGHSESDPNQVREGYIKAFDHWIHDSKLNRIYGLESFLGRDFCVGVTGYLDDLYVRYGSKIHYIKNEYAYHRRLGIGVEVSNFNNLKNGDQLIISCPFSFYGDIHFDMEEILQYCDRYGVNVHIDSAWYGSVRDFNFNYDRDCIKSVGFSLSKGLSLGHNRIGIRYSRNREAGPITIANDFNMSIVQLMWMGIQITKHFTCDFLQNKYGKAYEELCRHLNLNPTKAIHIAQAFNPDLNAVGPIGVSKALKKIIRARH